MKIIAIMLAAASLTAPAVAQNTMASPDNAMSTPPTSGTGQARNPAAAFAAMDKDGNGTIEKAEWLAAGRRDQGFTMLDANGDGKLTKEELRDGIARFRAKRGK